MRLRLIGLGAAVILLGPLAGCTGDEPQRTSSDPDGSSPASSGRPSDRPEPDRGPEGGPAASPATADPSRNLLDWTPVPGPTTTSVTRSGEWTLAVAGNGSRAVLRGPGQETTFLGDSSQQISDGLVDGDWAVVVFQDEQETQPATAEIVHLGRRGGSFTLDGSSDVPTTTGGTWALGEGRLVHPTIGSGGSYCLATVDLAERSSERTWCAEKRHGFNGARITPAGTSLMTFDDQRPSCRTVVELAGEEVTPFEGVTECLGWEGVITDDGAVWSVVPKQTRIEQARYYARAGDEYFDLGPGTSGTLVWCAGAAYFAQDPVRDGDPARLLRWTADHALEVVYESRGRGPAFLTEPRCGGDRITLTAIAESGDQQVSAPVG